MKKAVFVSIILLSASILLLFSACQPSSGPRPRILSAAPVHSEVGRYEPVDLVVGLQAEYTSPYDARQVALEAIFTAPDGRTWSVPGFWDADSAWRVRFAPTQEGRWTYRLTARSGELESRAVKGAFTVTPSEQRGFVQVASWVDPAYSPRYLALSSGEPFYAIGHCDAFTILTDGFDAQKGVTLFDRMRAAGENTVVYWPVYSNPFFSQSYDDYSLPDLRVIDTVVEDARKKGIYLVFTIWDHNELRAPGHPWGGGNWENQNGFRKLGGITAFFTTPEAWAWQENLYRYFIARWGYSTSIGMWQTVSEIEGTSAGIFLNPWHARVNQYFVEHDPYRRPTTASMAGDAWWPEGYAVMDVLQMHSYDSKSDPVGTGALIGGWTQKLWAAQEKPNFVGEFGTANQTNHPELLHSGVWAALAAGAALTPMEWNDSGSWGRMSAEMYDDLARLAQFTADLPLAQLNPVPLGVTPSERSLAAYGMGGQDWGVLWVQDVSASGKPIQEVRAAVRTVAGARLDVQGLPPGDYTIRPYDTWQGIYLPEFDTRAGADGLMVQLPDFQRDLALKIARKD